MQPKLIRDRDIHRRCRGVRLIGGVLKLALAAVFALVVGVLALTIMFVRGTAGVDDWVVRQVTLIANTYLVPQISFQRFDFTWPNTLTLHGVALTSPEGVEVVAADTFVVTLAERPRVGQPIVISAIDLEDAALRLIADPVSGGFQGLAPFVKREPIRSPERAPEQVRLSNVLRISSIQLRNGMVEYHDGSGGPPMRLDELDLDLDVSRRSAPDASASGDVWHDLNVVIDRRPIMHAEARGAVSLDSFAGRLDRLDLAMELGEASYPSLPTGVQSFLRQHDALGALRLLASGRGVLGDLPNAQLDATLMLNGFNAAMGEYRLPIDQATIELHLADGIANLAPIHASLLDGELRSSGRVDLTRPGAPLELEWTASRLELMELLRTRDPQGAAPKLAGRMNASGSAVALSDAIPQSIDGLGTLSITDARLVSIPVITRIAQVVDVLGPLVGASGRNSKVDAEYRLTGDAVQIESMTFTNPVAAARISGKVYYDQRLDLTMNAGPLERVQGLLGAVGGIFGALTDQIISYRVRGTVGQPSVSAHPLGIGS